MAARSPLSGPAATIAPTAAAVRPRKEVAEPAPSIWVSVDPSGAARTITPAVTEARGGGTTTLDAPPASLTHTDGAYILSPSGSGGGGATTLTGVPPPVATAKSGGRRGEGAFLACAVYQGADAPFCQPRGGSLLNPGNTYYVTWRNTYFQPNTTVVRFQADFHNGDGHGHGFTSDAIPAGNGYYAWTIAPDFLAAARRDAIGAELFLAYDDGPDGNPRKRVGGPTVVLTHQRSHHGDDNSDKNSGNGIDSGRVSPVAVVVPIVVVVALLLGLAGFCVWSYRRRGSVPFFGALRGRSTAGGSGAGEREGGGGFGYGIRSQHADAPRGATTTATGGPGGSNKYEAETGIQLTDRESWSPAGRGDRPGQGQGQGQGFRQGEGQGQGQGPGQGPGRNVFREELQRQRDREY